jgi:putative glutamine amidotransferase
MKPVILIAGAPAYDRLFVSPSVLLNATYSVAFSTAGALPLLAADLDAAQEYAEAAQALVLTGTAMFAPTMDLYPKLLQEEDPKRNAFDEAVYFAFKKAKKPILGICLGHQVINKYEGGEIISNFKFQDGVEHMLVPHSVKATKGSILERLFGNEFIVNSRHNDRVGKLAKSLTATAFSPDGVVEALEHNELPIYSVQWHPERTRGDYPEPANGEDMSPLFEWFVKLCTQLRR